MTDQTQASPFEFPITDSPSNRLALFELANGSGPHSRIKITFRFRTECNQLIVCWAGSASWVRAEHVMDLVLFSCWRKSNGLLPHDADIKV